MNKFECKDFDNSVFDLNEVIAITQGSTDNNNIEIFFKGGQKMSLVYTTLSDLEEDYGDMTQMFLGFDRE